MKPRGLTARMEDFWDGVVEWLMTWLIMPAVCLLMVALAAIVISLAVGLFVSLV